MLKKVQKEIKKIEKCGTGDVHPWKEENEAVSVTRQRRLQSKRNMFNYLFL